MHQLKFSNQHTCNLKLLLCWSSPDC